jgi:hypothetical protein
MLAPGHGIARVVGARILVIASDRDKSNAEPFEALVGLGADVIVVAVPRHGLVNAACQWIAEVACAWIGIIAGQMVRDILASHFPQT